MEILVGVSKVKKYATSESGDTLEFIERPGGGLSIVLADGQRSGKSAKVIANKVVGKVITLLSDGVRDGAAARAASDYLYHEKKGKVQSTLNILSVDLLTNTLVITRNNPAPVYIAKGKNIIVHNEDSSPIGIRLNTRPVITQLPIETGMVVLLFTDGITNAGVRYGQSLNVEAVFQNLLENPNFSAQDLSDGILEKAIELDQGRPIDDVSVVILKVVNRISKNEIRRVSIQLPLGFQ